MIRLRFSAVLLCAASLAAAQGGDTALATATWSVTPYVGAAVNSPAGYNWGTTPGRNHALVGVHFATSVLRAGRLSLMYAPSATPFVMVTNNPRYKWIVAGGVTRKVESGRGPVYGAGLAPFGLQADVRATRNVDFYSMAALGGIWFTDAMPQDGAKRFNFSIEFGGGLLIGTHRRHAFQLGYKFYHLSNMYTARQNPGLDGNVFYLGMRWQKRLPRE